MRTISVAVLVGFGGFTTERTWVVGVLCTTCATPVPLLLTVVEVK